MFLDSVGSYLHEHQLATFLGIGALYWLYLDAIAIVVLFMIIWYRFAGVVATVALMNGSFVGANRAGRWPASTWEISRDRSKAADS